MIPVTTKMYLKKTPLFISCFVLFISVCRAQVQPTATWEVGAHAGAAGYMGDLNLNNPLKISGYSGGVFVKRNFNPYIGLKLNYTYGQISGDDAKSSNEQHRERDLNFYTGLNELSVLFNFNFFDYKVNGGRHYFTPYLFAGVGGVNFNPKIKIEGKKYNLNEYATEGQVEPYKQTVLAIPYGLGFKYNYSNDWTIFTEIGYRTAFTDYLDDVSGVYPMVPSVITNGDKFYNLSDPSLNKIGVPGTQRGDFRKRDTYLFVSVGISFTFVSSKCYSF